MPILSRAAALLAMALLVAPAWAETKDHSMMDHCNMDHSKMDHSAQGAGADASPSTLAFEVANARMHTDMAVPYTGDADVDFIAGMIPHHQGAIDMARIVLEHGHDPEVRKLAEGVIAAQEAEIVWMTKWLAEHAPKKN